MNVYPASSNPLNGWDNVEFYGQRPWRLIKTLNNIEYDAIEADSVQALQFYENTKVDHSVHIYFNNKNNSFTLIIVSFNLFYRNQLSVF